MIAYLALLAVGVLTKLNDDLVDVVKAPNWIAYVTGIAYGALGAWVVLTQPILAPLGIGIIIGLLFTGKIDHPSHGLAIAAFLFTLSTVGFPRVDVALLVVFSAASLADELLHERLKHWFFRNRMSMETVALGVWAFTGVWQLLAGIIFFDIGYLVTGRLTQSMGKPAKRRRKQ